MTKQEKEIEKQIRQGLKEISEGKVVPLNIIEKREKIREGIEKFVSKAYWYEGEENVVTSITKETVEFLRDNDVAIKVGKMKFPYSANEATDLLKDLRSGLDMPLMTPEYQVLTCLIEGLETGYEAVEPLIEGAKCQK